MTKLDEKLLPSMLRALTADTVIEDSDRAMLEASADYIQHLQSKPRREKLPTDRKSITHKFTVNTHKGYMTVGLYEDGRPGELFITMAKEGSTVGGLMDAIGILTSIALQSGVPLIDLVRKFRGTTFEPMGPTMNKQIPVASSVVDYVFTWMGLEFCPEFAEEYRKLLEVREG